MPSPAHCSASKPVAQQAAEEGGRSKGGCGNYLSSNHLLSDIWDRESEAESGHKKFHSAA